MADACGSLAPIALGMADVAELGEVKESATLTALCAQLAAKFDVSWSPFDMEDSGGNKAAELKPGFGARLASRADKAAEALQNGVVPSRSPHGPIDLAIAQPRGQVEL